MTFEKRSQQISFKVTNSEFNLIKNLAETLGLTTTDLLVSLVQTASFELESDGKITFKQTRTLLPKGSISIKNSGNLITGNISGSKNKIKINSGNKDIHKSKSKK